MGDLRQGKASGLERVDSLFNSLWAACKAVYSSRITDCQVWEIAETFFNSLTRRVFATVGVNQQIEFVDTDFDAPPTVAPGALRSCYQDAPLPLLLAAILTDAGFASASVSFTRQSVTTSTAKPNSTAISYTTCASPRTVSRPPKAHGAWS